MRAHTPDPPDSPYKTLAAAVLRRRRALALTQKDLGDLAGCGRLFVHRLETAKSSLRLDKLLDVLTVLGLQLDITNGARMVVDTTDASD